MGLWTIKGGTPLYGTVRVQGSRNSAMAILPATLAVGGVSVLERVPRVRDAELMLDILRGLGCIVQREGERVTVDSREASMEDVPTALMERLRSSVLFLGAMIARFGKAAVPVAADCVLGPRPIDLHLAALQSLGAEIRLEDSMILCCISELRGGKVVLPYPDVGATANAMLAACGCKGEIILRGCAKDPEILDLAAYLIAAGAEITGAGTDTIHIRRLECITNVHHILQGDPMAAAALLCAVASCGGEIILQEVYPSHLQPILDELAEMGCNIKMRSNGLTLRSDGHLWAPTQPIETGPWPMVSADALPLLMAACLQADGVTILRDGAFCGRLRHTAQLRQLGGDISLTEDGIAVVTGVSPLRGASLRARDVWSGAAAVIAALQAEGETTVVDDGCISRSLAYLDAVLRQMGAEIDFTE